MDPTLGLGGLGGGLGGGWGTAAPWGGGYYPTGGLETFQVDRQVAGCSLLAPATCDIARG